jgi:alkylation response protein AidB-like acyl-CoA dehydrogenase
MDLSFTAAERALGDEARQWLSDHLTAAARPDRFDDADAEIEWGRRWQADLAADRWVGLWWPEEFGGRGASPVQVAIFNMEYARVGAPQPVNRVGINLSGPTLLAHGSAEQKQRWLPKVLDASELWCQLFSEPDAGSDLASLRTRAEPVDGGWLLSGQKVWTSYAQFARWGICLARTDPDAPKHRGISYLVVDMASPGIEIRPLVQITGEAEFNEVFLDEVFVPSDHLVGGLHDGWRVANTTLAHERGTNFPFKEQVVHEVFLDELYRLAHDRHLLDDQPVAGIEAIGVADGLAQAYVLLSVLRLHNWRTLSQLGRGVEPGAESSVVKLAWTEMTQHLSSVALGVLGDGSPVWDDDGWDRQWLWSQAASIAGGTTEIQKTIIAERLLGLPRG